MSKDWNQRLLKATNMQNINIQDITECLNNGANVNCKNNNQWTPLLTAICRNHFESVKLLVSRGADVNEVKDGPIYHERFKFVFPPQSVHPLLYSILDNKETIAKYLVNKGANVCKPDNRGRTALSCAIERQNMNMIEFLLDHGAKYSIPTAFLEAIKYNDLEVIRLLELKGADVIEELLGNGAVVDNSRTKVLLKKFVEMNNIKLLKLMIKNGVYLDIIDESDGTTLLTKAIENANEEIVNELVSNGADVDKADSNGNYPLIQSIKLGHFEIIKILLERFPNVNLLDSDGNCALLTSIRLGHFKIAKILIENGANINLPDSDGNLPLLKFVEMGNLEMVETLVGNGANLNTTDKFGDSLFIKALRKEHFEVVKYFVERGEDVNQINDKNETPLSIAASNYDFRTFQFLIDSGADINLASEKIEKVASSDISFDTYIKSLKKRKKVKDELFPGDSGQEEASIYESALNIF